MLNNVIKDFLILKLSVKCVDLDVKIKSNVSVARLPMKESSLHSADEELKNLTAAASVIHHCFGHLYENAFLAFFFFYSSNFIIAHTVSGCQ